jgi:hypothetical protein
MEVSVLDKTIFTGSASITLKRMRLALDKPVLCPAEWQHLIMRPLSA